ncbi:hypothetical protein A3J41_00580 [candidate division TM6 bacterium RIFCSPHIGHO2_12_FULL_38_8]|nr:MAG: hypothetical protein A3J41_00580 [candidate division TM6 bacterium RIFCSPHIGHO2_12_FULL_38_8]
MRLSAAPGWFLARKTYGDIIGLMRHVKFLSLQNPQKSFRTFSKITDGLSAKLSFLSQKKPELFKTVALFFLLF